MDEEAAVGEVQIRQLPAQLAIVVHTSQGTIDTSMDRMWEAVGVLTRHIEATRTEVIGPPFEYYPEPIEGEYSFAVGWPVAQGAVPGEGVAVEELPAVEAATLLHKGPYEDIWGAWERVREWMAANGRQPGGAPPREVYLNDPREVAEEELLTELVMPLA